MLWNPTTYTLFKEERFAPFYDLIAPIERRAGMTIIDLGCGTGEMTKALADALPGSHVIGIDSSAEMLAESDKFSDSNVRFIERTIEEQIQKGDQFDLVFSNAALQWVEDHTTLIPQILSMVREGGQIAIQMPDQHQNILNRILLDLSGESPFKEQLEGWQRSSPVLTLDVYAEMFFRHGMKDIKAIEKIYPVVLDNADDLVGWVAGTTMRPYIERLGGKLRDEFTDEFRRRAGAEFFGSPVFYPFRRMLLWGRKGTGY